MGFSKVFAEKLVESARARARARERGGGSVGGIRGDVDVEREVGRVMRNAGIEFDGGGSEQGKREGERGEESGVKLVKEEGERQTK